MKNSHFLGLFFTLFAITAASVGTFWAVFSGFSALDAIKEKNISEGTVLIIDPGHGGADGGAVSVTGKYESSINLEISKRVYALAGLFGVRSVMTRDAEEIPYPEEAGSIHAKKVWDTKRRVELANSLEDAFFLSIHQNKYTSSGPEGCQVFYAPTEGSRPAAETLQNILMQTAPGNRQNAVGISKEVYIMNNISCPGVLVECGFLSNPGEAKRLEDPEYQMKLAAAIFGGYLAGRGNS